MTGHIDILEDRESLRKPLYGSIALHGTVVLVVALQTIAGSRAREQWGSPNALGGGSVGITPVSQIPLPSRGGPLNPLASDTESAVPEPAPAKQKAQRVPEIDPSAIAIKGRSLPKRQPKYQSSERRARYEPSTAPGQLYSSMGRALSSPLVGQTGSGGVGMGPGGSFGSRFGAYRDLLEQSVARRWRTAGVDPRLQTAPPVIVTFVIGRNGSTSDVRVVQSSGNRTLDDSALRAIYEAGPFPPLPAQYERDDARIEFWFQLRR